MIHLRPLLLWGICVMLMACSAIPSAEPAVDLATTPSVAVGASPATSPTSATSPTTVSLEPSSTPAAEPQPDTPAVPDATAEAELQATALASIAPTATPEVPGESGAFGGIEGVQVLSLDGLDGLEGDGEGRGQSLPLRVVHSYGFHSLEQSHFVAIYRYDDNGWQQAGRIDLENSDFLDATGVSQVQVVPERIWLEVQSGAGAHSGVYDLLSFDGTTLRHEVAGFSPSPGAGSLEDLNGDGIADVVLNASDPYVFCYACGVREVYYQVLRWDGAQMAEVALTPLAETAPAALRELVNEAITLAQAGLWQEASLLAAQARELDAFAQNSTAVWDAVLIELTANGRESQARNGTYPLLDNLFYGDYTAVMGILSGYSAEELFSQPNPLVVGTVAEGFEQALVDHIQSYTTQALTVRPELAEAYFLRGWARALAGAENAEVLADVQRAADLAPDQPLIGASVEYLRSDRAGSTEADDTQAVVRAAEVYMQKRVGHDVDPTITIEKLAGDYARVQIARATDDTEQIHVLLKRERRGWQVVSDLDDTAPGLDMPPVEDDTR